MIDEFVQIEIFMEVLLCWIDGCNNTKFLCQLILLIALEPWVIQGLSWMDVIMSFVENKTKHNGDLDFKIILISYKIVDGNA